MEKNGCEGGAQKTRKKLHGRRLSRKLSFGKTTRIMRVVAVVLELFVFCRRKKRINEKRRKKQKRSNRAISFLAARTIKAILINSMRIDA